MRILHINSYFNGCPFYKNLFCEQRALGEDIRVFMPVAKGDKAVHDDYGDYTLVSENHGRYDRLLFPLKHNKILDDVRRQYSIGQFELIHAHSLFSNGYIAMRLKQLYGVPYIVAVRDADVNVFFKRMPHMRALGRRILSEASRVIFLSAPYRDQALAPYLGADELRAVLAKSAVIPNGIDRFWLDNAVESGRAPSRGALRLLLVGRASKRKNVPPALEATKLLIARGHDVRFDVVIGKVEDERILRRIWSYPFVTLHMKLPMRDLLPLYRAADIFVLPSLSETFGLVYAEAMTQGLPVIYTRGQGFDGQFPDGRVGFAVNPRDPMEIADRVERVLANYQAISANCVRESKRYDWAKFARAYDDIYREVIQAAHP